MTSTGILLVEEMELREIQDLLIVTEYKQNNHTGNLPDIKSVGRTPNNRRVYRLQHSFRKKKNMSFDPGPDHHAFPFSVLCPVQWMMNLIAPSPHCRARRIGYVAGWQDMGKIHSITGHFGLIRQPHQPGSFGNNLSATFSAPEPQVSSSGSKYTGCLSG